MHAFKFTSKDFITSSEMRKQLDISRENELFLREKANIPQPIKIGGIEAYFIQDIENCLCINLH